MKTWKSITATAVLAASFLPAGARAQLPAAQTEGGVEYVSGGFGLDESTAFKQAIAQWPLALTFASSGNGTNAYAGDVQVVIRDTQDATVLNVLSQGPYFLAKIPPGSYEVFATYEGRTQSRKVNIGSSGNTHVTFHWKRPASGPD